MWNQCSWEAAIFLFHFIGWVNKPRSKGGDGWERWLETLRMKDHNQNFDDFCRIENYSLCFKLLMWTCNDCTHNQKNYFAYFIFRFYFLHSFFQPSIWLQSYENWNRNYVHDTPIKFYNRISTKMNGPRMIFLSQRGENLRNGCSAWIYTLQWLGLRWVDRRS